MRQRKGTSDDNMPYVTYRLILSFALSLQALCVCAGNSWPPVLDLGRAFLLPVPAEAQAGAYSSGDSKSLAETLLNTKPWLALPANSEQRQPVYLGKRPRDIALGRAGSAAGLPAGLKEAGERQLSGIRAALRAKKFISADAVIEIEAWPARDDDGLITWTFAR